MPCTLGEGGCPGCGGPPGRSPAGRSAFGREDYGRGGFGTTGYGTGYGLSEGRGYGSSAGLGFSDYRGAGRGSEGYRERWDLRRDAGEQEGRGPLDKLREGARRLMGKGPKNYRRSDERIREDLNERLMMSWMDAEEVEVTVKDGEVTLTGSVYTRDEKRAIEDLAEDVLGVKDVHNNLRANRGGGLNPQPGSATREAGTSASGRGSMHS